jgi:hypothetical protein
VTGFPNQIDDRPMVFTALDMVEREFDQFTSSQSTTEQDSQDRSISLTFQRVCVR